MNVQVEGRLRRERGMYYDSIGITVLVGSQASTVVLAQPYELSHRPSFPVRGG